jgi:hypothetical protein
MEQEKPLSEQESLQIINTMIQRVKNDYYDSGTSAILWGAVIGVSGIFTFLQWHYNWFEGVQVLFWLPMLAIIPQIYIAIRDSKRRRYLTYNDATLGWVWITFAISMVALGLYQNIVPAASYRLMEEQGYQMVRYYTDGSKAPEIIQRPFILSIGSIYLLMYAFPTFITGWVEKFRAMIIGGFVCYALFIASCFTASKYDMLFAGIAAIFSWLIPGLILRKRYLQARKADVQRP